MKTLHLCFTLIAASWWGWQAFWEGYQTFYRIDDLKRLTLWAKRKRFWQVEKAYRGKLAVELQGLRVYGHYHPHTARWAYRFYQLVEIIRPKGAYRKGAGAVYRKKYTHLNHARSYAIPPISRLSY